MNESQIEFRPFPKMARLNREIIITEKLDGTNAQIFIGENGEFMAGSRNRWLTPDNDNYGFARWAEANKTELLKLGPGRHYGEWWGQGIQRNYGKKEKTFSLFNASRWNWIDKHPPDCCHIVPVLYQGHFSVLAIQQALDGLRRQGSAAVPGFADPEGIVIYHVAAGALFKVTLKDDDKPKGQPCTA